MEERNFPPPAPLNDEEARTWSKEKIMEEIDVRQEELDASEQWVREMDEYYARDRYRGAEPGWSRGAEEFQMRLYGEINFLKSLL